MSTGWSWYVIVLVASNILGCVWLLWWTARRQPGDPKPEDTSHFWDGDITEYNKPLPRWWINLFYLTIVFGVGYLAWYGGMGSYDGYAGWSSQREHARDKSLADATLETTFARYRGQPIDRLSHDHEALALGRSIFNNTCATCHGSSARGATGYPNLSDDIWHWGGSPERILETVLDGREAAMPEWDKVLNGMAGPDADTYVIAYLRSLKQPDSWRGDYIAVLGKPIYDGLCVACHGVQGKGNLAIGAPDLTDDYWLYGDDDVALRHSINGGRRGSMPAHRALLGETRSRLVASYVWSLSNPEKPVLPTKPVAAP